jgi:hypothetical protein
MGKFVNLARVDPARISTGVGRSFFHRVGGGPAMVFVSVIVVKECYLDKPKASSNGKLQKIIEGACIEGEWERLVGAIGQIIHAREYKAQLYLDNLTFGTAYGSPESCTSVLPFVCVCLIIETFFY